MHGRNGMPVRLTSPQIREHAHNRPEDRTCYPAPTQSARGVEECLCASAYLTNTSCFIYQRTDSLPKPGTQSSAAYSRSMKITIVQR